MHSTSDSTSEISVYSHYPKAYQAQDLTPIIRDDSNQITDLKKQIANLLRENSQLKYLLNKESGKQIPYLENQKFRDVKLTSSPLYQFEILLRDNPQLKCLLNKESGE